MRVVSLIASATEIVCALGHEKNLVGRSHECDYPRSILRLPALSRPLLDVAGNSRRIDRQVKTLLRQALSVYGVDAAGLKALKPDLIVTQTQCEVCAVSLKDVEKALCGSLGATCKIASLKPDSLADIHSDIQRVAAALGCPARGEKLNRQLKARISAVAHRTQKLRRPRVACIEWIDPLMAAGNWMPELVKLAGGINLFGQAGRHSPEMSLKELRAKDPDAIVVLPCGFDIPRIRAELPALTGKPSWRGLKAARAGRVFLADGNQYFNRPGPRIADSLEILAEILHPETFDFGFKGKGWVSLSTQ